MKLGVAIQVVVFGHVAPEGLDGGSALLQDPGQEMIHSLVDPFSALLICGVLLIHTERQCTMKNLKLNNILLHCDLGRLINHYLDCITLLTLCEAKLHFKC